MFSSLGVKGDMPSSSTQRVDKGKEKEKEPNIDDEEGKHETEHEFQLIDLGEDDEDKITKVAMKGKEANISELETNIEREKHVIDLLDQ